MAKFVRKLNNGNWHKPVGGDSGEPQADALKNFNTTHNNLSVFEVKGGEFDAARLAVAAAAKSQHLDKVDFLVFDGQLATQLNIPVYESEGKTLDQHANPLHRDLKIESAKKLCALTEALIDPRFEIQRIFQFEVAERIRNAIKNGSIDQNELEESMREDLKKFPPRNTKEVTK